MRGQGIGAGCRVGACATGSDSWCELVRAVKRDQGGRKGFVAVGGMLWSAMPPWIHVFVLGKKTVSQAGLTLLIILPQSLQ